MALREGRSADAARMMRHYLRDAGGLERRWCAGHRVRPCTGQLAQPAQRSGAVAVGAGLYPQVPLIAAHAYRDLATEDKLGLTMELKIPETDAAQESCCVRPWNSSSVLWRALSKSRASRPGRAAMASRSKASSGCLRSSRRKRTAAKPRPRSACCSGSSTQGSSRAILRAAVATPEQGSAPSNWRRHWAGEMSPF